MGKNFQRFVFISIFIAILIFFNDNYFHFDIKSNENKTLEQNQNLNFEYKVSNVVDGDTLDIEKLNGEKFENGKDKIRIRLLGIDTPETVAPNRPVECFGKEASDKAKSLAKGQEAAIEIDESQGLVDKYGRQIAYVYIKTGGLQGGNYFMLNEKLLEEGYAYEYTYNKAYKYQELFKSEEKNAKDKDLGLWSRETCSGLKTPVGIN